MSSGNAKYWWAVLYPDNMVDDWQEKVSDLVQVAGCYCIHDKDKDGHNGDRLVHYHMILAFNNTTTYNHALNVFREVAPGCHTCKRIIDIRHAFDYLIHDTDDCKKKGKYLYDKSERILFNNFDIGRFEQRSIDEKREDAKLLKKYIFKNKITNTYDLDLFLVSDPDIDDDLYNRFEDAQMSFGNYISNACKGVYQHFICANGS